MSISFDWLFTTLTWTRALPTAAKEIVIRFYSHILPQVNFGNGNRELDTESACDCIHVFQALCVTKRENVPFPSGGPGN